jgi:hypothetical protein
LLAGTAAAPRGSSLPQQQDADLEEEEDEQQSNANEAQLLKQLAAL